MLTRLKPKLKVPIFFLLLQFVEKKKFPIRDSNPGRQGENLVS